MTYEKDGKMYGKIDKLKIKIIPGGRKIQLTNLFNGNEALEEIGNNFINENVAFFTGNIYPTVEAQLEQTFTEIANEIVSGSTVDELFPDVPFEK
jgi:hypothetical protein